MFILRVDWTLKEGDRDREERERGRTREKGVGKMKEKKGTIRGGRRRRVSFVSIHQEPQLYFVSS